MGLSTPDLDAKWKMQLGLETGGSVNLTMSNTESLEDPQKVGWRRNRKKEERRTQRDTREQKVEPLRVHKEAGSPAATGNAN